MNRIIQSVTLATLAISLTGQAFALGFRNPDQNSRATAMGEAFVAQADDPSAIYYNPAGLTQVKGTQVMSGGYLNFQNVDFDGAGVSENVNDPTYTFHSYLATDLGRDDIALGLGFNIPFGNRVSYGKNSTFRYRLTDTNLKVESISLALAYQINDNLSLGAAFNYYDGQTELNRLVPFSILFFPLPVPDGRFRFDGEGQAFGATAGLQWKINDRHQIGLVYRSPFAIDFHGHAVVKNDATAAFGRSPATAEVEFPQSAAIGYSFRVTDKLRLEVDVEWTDWDTLDTVRLHSPNPAFATDPGSQIPFKWESSFFYELGAEYTLNDKWALRAGYIFSENSVPNSTYSPTLPDSNRHVFSAGVGFASGHIDISVTYQYSLSTDRKIKNSADTNFDTVPDLDGTWSSDSHNILITSSYKF